jgi:hypothetical protein
MEIVGRDIEDSRNVIVFVENNYRFKMFLIIKIRSARSLKSATIS